MLGRLRGLALVGGMTLSAFVGSFFLILPAIIVLLPISGARGVYRWWVGATAAAWLTLAAALLEYIGGSRIVLTGELPTARTSLLIANHHCRLDWMFVWCVCVRARTCSTLRIVLKEQLKSAPFFGWAMQAFGFIFLKRNARATDVARIERTLRYVASQARCAATLLLFPEGTDLSDANLARRDLAEITAACRCSRAPRDRRPRRSTRSSSISRASSACSSRARRGSPPPSARWNGR